MSTTVNEITGDRMHSGASSEEYKRGYDGIDWSSTREKDVPPKPVEEEGISFDNYMFDTQRLEFCIQYGVKFLPGNSVFANRIEYYGKYGAIAIAGDTMRECIDLAMKEELQ